MSKFEVISGVEGCCLVLDDTRIAGPKPWGGGTVIHAWGTDKEYKTVDTQSRWFQLFGTPERAAGTMLDMCKCAEFCDYCPLYGQGVEHCEFPDAEGSVLEWLRGDAE